ncbi:MAG TPA: hypothetical protein VF173_34510 [Thermoanaerobaculia bacterium]|nr:hypothetical protein [Thermoanaerobaculia bacterium]
MRGFLAVFEREIVERRLLFVVALVLGLVPLAMPLFPGLPAASPTELRNGTAMSLALVLSFVLAVLLGGTVIARDLVERRFGFYFSRPLPGAAIWGGKLAAAAVLAAGAGILVLLPTSLLGSVPDPSGAWGATFGVVLSRSELFAAWLGVLGLVLAASHAASVILRSRSPWLLLDVMALGVTATIAWACFGALARHGAGVVAWTRYGAVPFSGFTLLQHLEIAFLVTVLIALAAAGAVQVIQGRTDLRRGHRALSMVLWGVLLPASLVLAGYTWWFETPAIEDLVTVEGEVPSPAGSWIALYGQAAHRGGYFPGFLFDVGSGRTLRAGFGNFSKDVTTQARFSADGRRAFWLEVAGGDPIRPWVAEVQLFSLDLRRPDASPRPTGVVVRGRVAAFAISPDSRYVAISHTDRLMVIEIGSGRLLASVARRDWFFQQEAVEFPAPGRVRFFGLYSSWYPQSNRPHGVVLSIRDLDVATGKLTETTVPNERMKGMVTWTPGPQGVRGLWRTREVLELRDGATGALVARLGGEGARASFLPDGRVALLERSPEGSDLRLLDPGTGAEVRRFHFAGMRTVLVADQPALDRLRVVTRGSGGTVVWRLWTLHLSTGQAVVGPQLALTSLPYEGAGPWPKRRGRDGVVWFDVEHARDAVLLRSGLPAG